MTTDRLTICANRILIKSSLRLWSLTVISLTVLPCRPVSEGSKSTNLPAIMPAGGLFAVFYMRASIPLRSIMSNSFFEAPVGFLLPRSHF